MILDAVRFVGFSVVLVVLVAALGCPDLIDRAIRAVVA